MRGLGLGIGLGLAMGSTGAGASGTPIVKATFGAPFKYNSNYPTKYIPSDTWAPFQDDNGDIITFNCDSQGWQGASSSNMQLSKLSSATTSLTGSSVNAMTAFGTANQKGTDGATYKAIRAISIAGKYIGAVARMTYAQDDPSGDVQHSVDSQIITSTDHGATWLPAPPSTAQPYASPMFPGTLMPTPSFLNFGKNYADAGPFGSATYLYAYSSNAWNNGDWLKLFRCPVATVFNRSAGDWQGYIGAPGGDVTDSANWGVVSAAVAIYSASKQVSQPNIHYIPALGRFVWFNAYYPSVHAHDTLTTSETSESVWALMEAPTPSGPWTQFQTASWNPQGFYTPAIFESTIATDGGLTVMLATTGDYWTWDPATGDYTLTLIPLTLSASGSPPTKATNSVAPVITKSGTVLTVTTPGTWSGAVSKAYQWWANGVKVAPSVATGVGAKATSYDTGGVAGTYFCNETALNGAGGSDPTPSNTVTIASSLAFDPAAVGTGLSLSGGNLVASRVSGATFNAVKTNISITSGIKLVALTATSGKEIGIALTDGGLSLNGDYAGGDTHTVVWYDNFLGYNGSGDLGGDYSLPRIVQGDVFGLIVVAASQTIFFYHNGTVYGGTPGVSGGLSVAFTSFRPAAVFSNTSIGGNSATLTFPTPPAGVTLF